jgi:hypothetical protein
VVKERLWINLAKLIRVKNGRFYLEKALEEYIRLIYRYNTLIRETGYYLKPVHIVTKKTNDGKKTYIYIGRYWWKIKYVGKRGRTSRIKWIYVGKEKPAELKDYPDPPYHPLAGLKVVIDGNDVLIDEKTLRKYRWLFEQSILADDSQ